MHRFFPTAMMALLLDSHVLVWFGAGDRRLSRQAHTALIDPDSEVFVSVVSYWELEIKQSRSADLGLPEPVSALMERSNFLPLELAFDTPSLIARLPDIHGDPFDRMLIAQALHHGLTLVTGDRTIRRYPVKTLW